MEITPLGWLLIQFGALGITAFTVWHTLTKAIPRLIDGAEAKDIAFLAALREQRHDFRLELQSMSERHAEAERRFASSLDQLTSDVRALVESRDE